MAVQSRLCGGALCPDVDVISTDEQRKTNWMIINLLNDFLVIVLKPSGGYQRRHYDYGNDDITIT